MAPKSDIVMEHQYPAKAPSYYLYWKGCRCDACREMKRVYMADLRKRRKGCCKVAMCNTPVETKGLCSRCYQRWRDKGRPPIRTFIAWASPAPGDTMPNYVGDD